MDVLVVRSFQRRVGLIGILCGSQIHGGDGVVEEVNYVLPIKYVWERIITNQNNSQQGE